MSNNPALSRILYCALIGLYAFIFTQATIAAQTSAGAMGAKTASSTESGLANGHEWVKVDGPQIDKASWIALDAMVNSPLPSLRDQALDSIESAIKNGETGPGDPNVVNLLGNLCLTPLTTKSAPGTSAQPDLPLLRIRSLRMAALLGGDNAHALFLEVLQTETEPNVLAQAHAGLRQLLRQPGNLEINLIVDHLKGNYPNGASNALALELLADIKAYHGRWNTMARQDILDALLKASQDSRYLEMVRTQAGQVIKFILGFD